MISTNKNSPTILGNYFVLFLDIQGVREGLFSGIPTVLLDGAEIGREKNIEVETLNRTIGEFCGALGQMAWFIKTMHLGVGIVLFVGRQARFLSNGLSR